jgi:hypothetical protein
MEKTLLGGPIGELVSKLILWLLLTFKAPNAHTCFLEIS